MHQPHAEGAHHQPLAAHAVGRDPVPRLDLVAQLLGLRGGPVPKHRAHLFDRTLEKPVGLLFNCVRFAHPVPLPTPASSLPRFAAASPPSKTALPATIMSTPMAAIAPALSRVTPP